MSNLIRLVIFVFITNWFISCKADVDSSIMTGDLIFQESMSLQCIAVQIATKSRYSHVGIIFLEELRLKKEDIL